MKFTFNVTALSGRLPGLPDAAAFYNWARGDNPLPDSQEKIGKTRFLPMMTARRMCAGSRFAADLALELLQQQTLSAAVFSSRHGELEHSFSIQSAIAAQTDVSPTDFAMSVHNAAAGSFSIAGKQKIPITSISAGKATFPQALAVAASLLRPASTVLLVNFDSYLPEFFREGMQEKDLNLPYAVGILLTPGEAAGCNSTPQSVAEVRAGTELPCALQFARHCAQGRAFSFADGDLNWQFSFKGPLRML